MLCKYCVNTKMLCKYYPKQSADSNVIAISLNDFFLTEIEKSILKFVWNLKRIAKKKKTLKNNKIEGLTPLDFKT